MKSIVVVILLIFGSFQLANAQGISEWREKDRTGISPETGLLKTWPTGGPTMLWASSELPKGHSSPSFSENAMFITGMQDSLDILVALDLNGKILWKAPMGRAWNASFPESRATPTVENNRVYTCSGLGDLMCFDATNGKVIWQYKGSEVHKGTFGLWGIAESLLIDGDVLYFSPGGSETMTIALKKATGELVWKSASLNDKPGYVSPILVDYAGKKTLINVAMNQVFAVDVANGEILWKVAHIIPADFKPDWELIKCVTPVFIDGSVYVTGGYNTGGMMINIDKNGKAANIAWTDSVLDVHHGGVVVLDGYIYGSNWLHNGDGNWCCIEWKTGKKMWEEHWFNKGSIIAAEGLLYIYDEKKGNMGLVKPTPEKFELISSFQVTLGSKGPFWAHPVIHNGILYLRHNDTLMAYDIKLK